MKIATIKLGTTADDPTPLPVGIIHSMHEEIASEDGQFRTFITYDLGRRGLLIRNLKGGVLIPLAELARIAFAAEPMLKPDNAIKSGNSSGIASTKASKA